MTLPFQVHLLRPQLPRPPQPPRRRPCRQGGPAGPSPTGRPPDTSAPSFSRSILHSTDLLQRSLNPANAEKLSALLSSCPRADTSPRLVSPTSSLCRPSSTSCAARILTGDSAASPGRSPTLGRASLAHTHTHPPPVRPSSPGPNCFFVPRPPRTAVEPNRESVRSYVYHEGSCAFLATDCATPPSTPPPPPTPSSLLLRGRPRHCGPPRPRQEGHSRLVALREAGRQRGAQREA